MIAWAIGWLMLLLPAAVGFCVALCVSKRPSNEYALLTGLYGAITSYIIFGLLLAEIPRILGRNLLYEEIATVLVVLFCSTLWLLTSKYIRTSEARSLIADAFPIFISLALSAIYMNLVSSPLQSWDSMTYWAANAFSLIDWFNGETSALGYSYQEKHPTAVIGILAFAALSSNYFGVDLLTAPWCIAGASLVSMLFYFLRHLQVNRLGSFLSVFFLSSIPLYENHFLLFGYAELWLAACLSGLIFVLAANLDRENKLAVGTLLLGFVIVTVKNTGIIYYTSIVIALVLCFSNWRHICAGLIVGCMFFGFSSRGFSIRFPFVNEITWDPSSDGGILVLANRFLYISPNNITEVANAALYSLAINNSFSVIALSFIIIISMEIKTYIHRRVNYYKSDSYGGFSQSAIRICLAVLVCSSALIYVGLYLSDYLLQASTFKNDTSGSRLLLPLVPTFIAVIALAGHRSSYSSARGYV